MMWWLLCAAVFMAAIIIWSIFTAQRLNRLHIRVDSSLNNVQSALDRRAALSAHSDPALSAAAAQAEACLLVQHGFAARAEAERELAQAMDKAGVTLPQEDARVLLALRFYNEAVADTRALRLRPLVKFLRLGGTARLPEYLDLNS